MLNNFKSAASERNIALADISRTLENISSKIKRIFSGCIISYKRLKGTQFIRAMIISINSIAVKIEPNLIIRGAIYEPEEMALSKKAQNLFEMSLNAKTLSFAELYGSKICAALDRQHPRDLFDIHLLFKNEGINEKIRKAFIVYLISHPRPIVEVLNPNFLDIKQIFENEFQGMTTIQVDLDELEQTRKRLVSSIRASLTENEKNF
jgi:hypothetical protein